MFSILSLALLILNSEITAPSTRRANIDETESATIITEQGGQRIIVSEAKIAVPFLTSSPDPELPATAQRRKFSVEDKKRILEDVERTTGHGGIGAVLRREGIYSSTLYGWT